MVRRIFEKENLLLGNRFVLISVVFIFLTSLLVFRLWYVQVLYGDYYQKISDSNHISKLYIPAARGKIYDRHGSLILGNRAFYDLVLVPQHAKNTAATLQRLENLLGISAESMKRRLNMGRTNRAYNPIPLMRNLTLYQVSIVEAHVHELPGIYIQTSPRRDYKPSTPPHLVGFLGEVNTETLKNQTDIVNPYILGDLTGKQGLEKQWETYLRGKQGFKYVQVDAHGRIVDNSSMKLDLPTVPAQNGDDLILTLDMELQKAASRAFKGKNGAVVAMNPQTGEILALISEPTFDISLFQNNISWDRWQSLRNHPLNPMLDKTTGGEFPPGSLYKTVVALAGLEEGLITPETRSYCPGHYKLGKETFHCHQRQGHGQVNMKQAIEQSCDIFFYELGMKLGINKIAKYAKDFYLGKVLGLNINPERHGLIPTSEWHTEKFNRKWRTGYTPNISIGQGFNLLTPLQMVSLFSALSNDGKVWQPFVVHKVINQFGTSIYQQEPRLLHTTSLIRPESFKLMRESLQSVVEGNKGTGTRARLPNITVAGKTGTVQVVSLNKTENNSDVSMKWKEHAIFAAFSPVEKAEIVVLVFSQNEAAGGGGVAAAPVVHAILEAYYKLKDQRLARNIESTPKDKSYE